MEFKISKFRYNDYIKWVLRVVMVFFMIYYYSIKDNNGLFGGFLVLGASFFCDLIFELLKIRLPAGVDLVVQGFVYAALFLGKMLRVYEIIPTWDTILHLFSGALLGFIGLFILQIMMIRSVYKQLTPAFFALFIFTFGTTAAGVWEIWEFSTDILFGLSSQGGSLYDTMVDICAGTIGTSFSMVITYAYYKNKMFKSIGRLLDSFAELNQKD